MTVSWNIALGLMVMAFLLPFIFLHSQMAGLRRRSRSDHDELEHLRTICDTLSADLSQQEARYQDIRKLL